MIRIAITEVTYSFQADTDLLSGILSLSVSVVGLALVSVVSDVYAKILDALLGSILQMANGFGMLAGEKDFQWGLNA